MHDLIQNIKMLQSANRRLPGALWYCIGEAVFDTAHVYLPLWIFAWILQAVSDGDMQRFAVSAVLCVIVQAVTDWLSRLVQEKRIAYARRCNEVGINEVYEKIARLSYETYQDDEIRQRCNTALENLYYEFDYSDLIQEEAAILDNGCKVAAALCMTAVLLLQPPVIGGGWGLAAEPVVCGILFAAVTGLLIGMNLYRQKSREGERVRLLREHSATESRLLYLQNSVVFAFPQYLSYRLFDMKPMLVRRMKQNSDENVAFFERLRGIGRYISNGYALSSALSTLCSFWLVIVKIVSGALPVTLLLTYVQGILQLHDALLAVTVAYGRIRLSAPYFRSIEAVMELPEPRTGGVVPQQIHTISFRNVCYRYPGAAKDAVHDLNLELAVGQWHVLVGANGSGKTTLLLLLMRYLTPTSGCILLDGTDIQTLEPDAYRKLFSGSFQAGGIYPVRLDENVSFAKESDAGRVCSALKAAGAGREFADADQCGKSLRGRSLSGGEAQKILSARAFYRPAPVYLFDEPAAALDPFSEERLYREIIALAEEHCVLFVSHRLSVCRECGDILVMKNGTLCERGTHESLRQRNGEYASLWDAQASTYRYVAEE